MKSPLANVTGLEPGVPSENANVRDDGIGPGQGAGMQITLGTVEIFRFPNVWVPEQPLKLYAAHSVVSVTAEDTSKEMATPCAVVPAHRPTLRDDGSGAEGDPPHAPAITVASVACTHVFRVVIFTVPRWRNRPTDP